MLKKMFAGIIGAIGVGLNKKSVFKAHIKQLLKQLPEIDLNLFTDEFINDLLEQYLELAEHAYGYKDLPTQTEGLERHLLSVVQLIRPDLYAPDSMKNELTELFPLQVKLLKKHEIALGDSL